MFFVNDAINKLTNDANLQELQTGGSSQLAGQEAFSFSFASLANLQFIESMNNAAF